VILFRHRRAQAHAPGGQCSTKTKISPAQTSCVFLPLCFFLSQDQTTFGVWLAPPTPLPLQPPHPFRRRPAKLSRLLHEVARALPKVPSCGACLRARWRTRRRRVRAESTHARLADPLLPVCACATCVPPPGRQSCWRLGSRHAQHPAMRRAPRASHAQSDAPSCHAACSCSTPDSRSRFCAAVQRKRAGCHLAGRAQAAPGVALLASSDSVCTQRLGVS